jgi:polyhydroxyalkanoate synthesis regulator phasin
MNRLHAIKIIRAYADADGLTHEEARKILDDPVRIMQGLAEKGFYALEVDNSIIKSCSRFLDDNAALKQEQAEALVTALGKGKDGEVTEQEARELEQTGPS